MGVVVSRGTGLLSASTPVVGRVVLWFAFEALLGCADAAIPVRRNNALRFNSAFDDHLGTRVGESRQVGSA